MSGLAPLDFSLVIAFLLPGFVAFYALTFLSPRALQLFDLLLSKDAGLGVSLAALLASLAAGVMTSGVRALIVDPLQRATGLKLEKLNFSRLSKPEVLAAFKEAVGATYRFSQFYGNMFVALALLLVAKYGFASEQMAQNWRLFALILVTAVVLLFSHRRLLRETNTRLSEILSSP